MTDLPSRGMPQDYAARLLVENLDQGILVLNPEGRCLEVNDRMARWLERPAEQLRGQSVSQLFSGRSDHYPTVFQRALRGERVEYEDHALSGSEVRTAQMVVLPLRNPEEQVVGVLTLCRDVTDDRRRDEELRQARKLASVENTAVGLTHDLRNLLTVIRGHLDLLTPEGDSVLRQDLEPVITATERAMELSGRFLTSARQQVLSRAPLDLNTILSEMATILGPQIGPSIQLEVRPGTPLAKIVADSTHMSRMLLNLCLNAVKALAAGGRLQLETTMATLGPADLADHPQGRPGTFVRLTVADSGPGLPMRIRERVYDLFQRGRSDSEGFGIGLAVVAGIVEQHDGWMECDSATGAGTCFHIYLPAMEAV